MAKPSRGIGTTGPKASDLKALKDRTKTKSTDKSKTKTKNK